MINLSELRIYLRLLSYVKPYWRITLIALVAMVCTAIIEPIIPGLMRPLVDQSLIGNDRTSMWQIPLFIFMAFAGKGVADYVANVASQYVAQRVMEDIRRSVFSHSLNLPIGYHQLEPSGRMLTRITYDTATIGEAVSTAWVIIIRDSLVILGLLTFLIYTAWQLAIVVLAIAPLVALLLRYASKRIRTSSERVQKWMGRLTGYISEAFLGLKEIKIFSSESKQQAIFGEISRNLRQENMRIIRVQALNVPLVQVCAAFAVSFVIYFASILSASSLLTPGEFVAFITAMSMIFEPIRRLTNVNAALQRGIAGAQSIFSLLDQSAEKQFKTQPLGPEAESGCVARGYVQFNSVSYRYPGQSVFALREFNLVMQPGESVVIYGPSGAGKSTLFHLLAKFATPESGEILLDDKPIDTWDLHSLRANISLVSQHVMLFDGTIKENVAMGNPNASLDEIIQACRAANAWEFIERLPDGLNTPLGVLGNALSGGQRQRIAIARAFLKDSTILLLDEPTSALDRESEGVVLEGLQALIRGRTTLIVSHSPERLLKVDRFIRLDSGSNT